MALHEHHPRVSGAAGLVCLLALVHINAFGQSVNLALGSASAQPGASISVPLSLTSTNTQIAGVMWSFAYSTADITGVSVVPAGSAVAASKTIDCAAGGSGRYTCIMSGTNTTSVANGTIANATFTLANTSAATTSVQVLTPSASSPAGDTIPTASSAGTITINRSVALSGISCSPATLTAPGSTQCTVALTAAAGASGFPVAIGYSATGVGVTVPSTVTVPSGSTSAAFTLQATSASSTTNIALTATAAGITKTTSVQVSPQNTISVTVSPGSATLAPAQRMQFSANITGTTNTAVTWSLSSPIGSISSTGLYTAPSTVTSSQSVTVRATSVASNTRVGTATVVIQSDVTPPVISSLSSTPSSTSAVVNWATNEPSTTVVEYGTSASALSSVASSASLVTTHQIMVSGLSPGTKYYYRVRSADALGNTAVNPSSGSVSFTTTSAPSTQTYTVFPVTATPAVPVYSDRQSVELGMKFYSSVSGYVTGVRFYKGSTANAGTHIANLWTAAGQKLASATVTDETSSGWQQVTFATPIRITANTTYVVSYFAPRGQYSVTTRYFTSTINRSPLLVPVGASLYRYATTSSFPDRSFNNNNYWVDVMFKP